MKNLRTIVLFLALFLCTNLAAQNPPASEKNNIQQKRTKPEKKKIPKTGVKAKIIYGEDGKEYPRPQTNVTSTDKQEKELPSKMVQNPTTKFASATNRNKKNAVTQPKPTLIHIDNQIKSLEERIVKIQKSDILNKQAELDKLNVALTMKKNQKKKSK